MIIKRKWNGFEMCIKKRVKRKETKDRNKSAVYSEPAQSSGGKCTAKQMCF